MTIQPLGSSAALDQAGATRRPPAPPTMTNTAQALGLSADDLQTQLASGATLDSLASSKGVSSDDLLSAVKSDLQANKPADAPDLSDDQLTQMATSVAAGQGPGGVGGPGGAHGHHGHHHHGGGGGAAPGTDASDPSQNLQTLADALGTTSDDLMSKLQSGTDMSSLFGESGSATWSSQGGTTGGLAVDQYA